MRYQVAGLSTAGLLRSSRIVVRALLVWWAAMHFATGALAMETTKVDVPDVHRTLLFAHPLAQRHFGSGAHPPSSKQRPRLAPRMAQTDVHRVCGQINAKIKAVPSKHTAMATTGPRLGMSPQETAVVDAVTRLFQHYDTNNDGHITLRDILGADTWEGSALGDAYSRASSRSSRRSRHLFMQADTDLNGLISQEEFITTLAHKFDKRIKRGLSLSRALAEIQVHHVSMSEMYGSE